MSRRGNAASCGFATALLVAAAAVAPAETVVGGSELDRGVGIAMTAGGELVVVGVTRSQGAGAEDGFIARIDAHGTVLWQKTLGGPGDDAGWAVLETDDGGLIVGGFTGSEGAGGLDCQLIRTDSRGAPLWSRTFGGEADDRCWAVAATGEGGYVLAGETASSGAGERDCYLVRTDEEGRELWSRTYGGERDDRCFSVAPAADGGYVLAGQTFSQGAGDRDAWIVWTDRDGRLLRSKTHGGEASDVAHSVAADGRGALLVTGYTTSLAQTPDDPMLLGLTLDGTVEWARVLSMEGHNRTLTGAPAEGGGWCLSGFSVAGDPTTVSALVVKVDDTGRELWSTRILPTARGESFAYGVTGTPGGGCAMVGHTTVGSAGDLDLLYARLDAEGRAVPAPAVPADKDNAGFCSSYRRELAGASQKVGRLAEAIPGELWGWRPAPGVRSVGEAMMHIANGNFLLSADLGLPRPDDLPEDLEAVTGKLQALDLLGRSLERVKTAFEQACAGDLERQVWDDGTTARGVLLRILAHLNEHLGQLIAYARVNGVVPPWSR